MSVTIDELSVQFSASGVAQLLEAQRTIISRNDAVQKSVDDVGKKSAMAARNIAGNVAAIAAVGEATAGSLKGILTQGANVAFMFGTGGAIAGAIGMTGLAIFNLFTRTRREIEETARKAGEELRQLAMAGSLAGIGGKFGVATQLFSGDRFAVQQENEDERRFQARKMGIQGVRSEMERLQAIIEKNKPRAGEMFGGFRAQDFTDATKELKAWRGELDRMLPRYEALIRLQRELEEQESYAAQQNVNRLRAQYDESTKRTLDDLADKSKVDLSGTSQIGKKMGAINPVEMWDEMVQTMRDGLKKIPPIPVGELSDELREILRVDAVADTIGQQFGAAVVDGITQGITAAFSEGGLMAGFESLTGALLIGLGHMAIQVGTKSAAFLALMKTIQDAIAAFLPGVGLVASFALIGLGASMIALGSGMGGRSAGAFGGGYGGGYGGGGGSYGGTSTIGVINPPYAPSPPNTGNLTPLQPIQVNATFIGARDPTVQRDMLELIKFARQRGEV